jgi:hypothetical protein
MDLDPSNAGIEGSNLPQGFETCSDVFGIGFLVPCSKPIPRQRIPIFLSILFTETNVYITIYGLNINIKEYTGRRGGNGFHIVDYLLWNR